LYQKLKIFGTSLERVIPMIEREFIAQKTKEYYIKQYVEKTLNRVGISRIRLKKIPLGEKIIIDTSRPSFVVGSKGSNIKQLTKDLKNIFKLENPQIEINEVKEIFLDASLVAEYIANSLERFGSKRFKGVGHRVMGNVIGAGALGVEVLISGKIPGSRARTWRFYQGYLKKCGDVAVSSVRKAQMKALLKSGIIGIKVSIMPPNIVLPDHIAILDEPIQIVEEVTDVEEKPKKKKKAVKKTTKKVVKKETKKKKKSAVPTPEVKEEAAAETPQPENELKSEVKIEGEQKERVASKEETSPTKEGEGAQPAPEETPQETLQENQKETQEVKNEDN
jgi:small subunit ribosomal protein S3